ncbi:CheR family methyltransferase [Gloeobacter violaceus]|uniref:Chemotaxis protein methyltransferase n=1 Tax=Gloeobacter violaceus (strain ATCC 29082 / PCC 7421) TaxID=251221 RepID=Q7NG43_GLOVI|nr:protein-glutamate O-methyltransferase CheR [Gloeobacter violaceus]BAC91271.1 chemotaxis protein methyltransferase [Gloeobacter violaceus PCC 7421]
MTDNFKPLSAAGLPARVAKLSTPAPRGEAAAEAIDEEEAGWNGFCLWLATVSNIDIFAYKSHQLHQRLVIRRQLAGVESWADYRRHLLDCPQAFARLRESLVTSVSSFFRDPEQWQVLESRVLPRLAGGGPLSAWSVGCAMGQEPYSLAVCLDGAGRLAGSKLVGSDCSAAAIEQARRGVYRSALEKTIPERLHPYAQAADGVYTLCEPLRRAVEFRCEDVFRRSFDGGWDLIFCRNVLIYLNEGAQRRLLRRLAHALRPGGVLFVGRSERVTQPEVLGLAVTTPYLYRRVAP